MLPERRHVLILRTLRSEGPVSIGLLADRLNTSPATIRRDLVQLADEGLLRRVHGGAAPTADRDDPFTDVAEVRVKDAIAHKCADLVKDGETVLLDIVEVVEA